MSLKNRNSLCNALLITDWQLNDTGSNISVNNMYSSFANKYLNLINMYCPLKSKVVSNETYKPWIRKNLINCCRKKQQLYKKSLNNSVFKLEYINYRNTLNNTIRKAKSNFYHKQINENKNNLKRMWSTINSIINRSKAKNNSETFNIDINYANNYFRNVGYETVKKIPNVKSNVQSYLGKRQIQSIFLNPVSENEIVNIINQLPVTSAGYDNIPSKLLKLTIEHIKKTLRQIFYASLSIGYFSDLLKIARVVSIFKSGNSKIILNYRLISILPYISKIIEKIMYNRLSNYLTKYNLLTFSQHGFSASSSTTTALVDVMSYINAAVSNKDY